MACGNNLDGQCNVPLPQPGNCYIASFARDLVFQLFCVREDDAIVLTCLDLAGHEALRLEALVQDSAWETHKRIAQELSIHLLSLRLILPSGELLASICRANPLTTMADVSEHSV